MRNWADLPEELLSFILSNLFAKDKYSFVRVCKSWSSAAAVSPYRHSLGLMFYEKNNDGWKFFQYNGIFFRNLPQLYDSEILCFKHGWLLMSCYYCNLFFYDPFNYRSIEVLPVMDFPYKTICFFKPPTSSDCTIVGISSVLAFSPCVKIGVLKMGEGEWKIHKYKCNTRFVFSGCTPIMHRGLLYYLDVKGNIGTFNINKHGHESSWVVHTKCLLAARFCNKTKQHFFIKHHGEETLFVVFVAHDERKVNVYSFLEPGMKWELVEDLGDKRLVLSRTSSIIET